jgi:hypothetical protein
MPRVYLSQANRKQECEAIFPQGSVFDPLGMVISSATKGRYSARAAFGDLLGMVGHVPVADTQSALLAS